MMSLSFRITAVLVCFSVAARTDPALALAAIAAFFLLGEIAACREAWIEHHKEQTT